MKWLAAGLLAFLALFRRKPETGGLPEDWPHTPVYDTVPAAIERLRPWAERYATPRVSALLLLALWEKESSGNPQAIGDNGKSFGLGQVQLATDEDFRKAHGLPVTRLGVRIDTSVLLLTEDYNAQVSAWTLDQRIQAMGGTYAGLRAYNCGVGGATRSATCGAVYAANIIGRVAQWQPSTGGTPV